MSFRRTLYAGLLLPLILGAISVEIACGETATGVVQSAEALDQTIRKWKIRVANTSERQVKGHRNTVHAKGAELAGVVIKEDTKKDATYGAFYWCITAEKKGLIRYAYTYGEPDPAAAKKKAAQAFDDQAGRGSCLKPPRLLTISNDNL